MRTSLLAFSSIALVAIAAGALSTAALAQEAPVVYRTDPGEAHPRYADRVAVPAEPTPMKRVSVSDQEIRAVAAPSALQRPDPIMQPATSVARPYEVSASGYAPATSYQASAVNTITVAPGDTVYAVARRYGVSPTQIISQNGLLAPYKLSIGQVLTLPGQTAAPMQSVPVAMAAPMRQAVPSVQSAYIVRQGDTLYGLSRRFGVPVAQLASANNLYTPYSLTIDQRLSIPGISNQFGQGMPAANPAGRSTLPPLPGADQGQTGMRGVQPILVSKNPSARFAWPLRGAVIQQYGVSDTGERYDGINIAAPVGAPVRASDDGEVVYTGSELEGYGNLLLIRHQGGWVSAYAHTDSIMVRKGDKVRQGQVVAKVGSSGNVSQPQLHFELRHDLQPRDPMLALTGRDNLARADIR